jgi:hypothetical protein
LIEHGVAPLGGQLLVIARVYIGGREVEAGLPKAVDSSKKSRESALTTQSFSEEMPE